MSYGPVQLEEENDDLGVKAMNIIQIDRSNIDNEHICCAISDKKGETCVSSKKTWMKSQFDHGLIFKRLNARGKVFIEYIPAENAWCPIEAEGYIYINCLWVSGQYKGQGYADKLLEECITDAMAQNKKGLVILSSDKKMPFLSDPNYLKYKGFKVCDTAQPYYELLYLPLKDHEIEPRFKDYCKNASIEEKGMVLYYTNQCPHTDKYVPLIAELAKSKGQTINLKKIESKEQAQNAPTPFTTYSFFYNGTFVTNEIFSESKFLKFLNNVKLSMCGYCCEMCKAYAPNIKLCDERSELANMWKKYYDLDIAPESIYCDGCRCISQTAKRVDNDCPVRVCVMSKGIEDCSECRNYPCNIFLQRKGLSYDEAKNEQKDKFNQKEYLDYLLAYDNKSRLDRKVNLEEK